MLHHLHRLSLDYLIALSIIRRNIRAEIIPRSMPLSPGKRATAELHLQLPRAGAAGPDTGDALLVQGDVEQHPCLSLEAHHELLHGEHPVRGAVPGVVGVHLVAAGGEQDLSADRGGQREHAVPTEQAVPDRPGQAAQVDAAAQRPCRRRAGRPSPELGLVEHAEVGVQLHHRAQGSVELGEAADGAHQPSSRGAHPPELLRAHGERQDA
jgi:hypothetical protein